jgi:tetratricopeptide (TPR) repeat protein
LSTLRLSVLVGLIGLLAVGCAAGPPYQQPATQPAPAPPLQAPAQPPPAPQPAPPPPAPPQAAPQPPQPTRQFRLGPAAAALVNEARQEAANGDPQLALSTVERALRIEPKNPLLWLILGQAHQGAGQYDLAGSMGRKALQLAAGDTSVQSRAWRLIGDSLRARGRNQQADEAYARADTLAAQ